MFDNIKAWAVSNGYELATEIPENWDRYKDGCPSVTTILSLLKDPGFEYVKKLYPDQLKLACDRGTRIHGEAEDFFDGGDPVIHNQIMKFHILHDVQILDQELNWKKGGIQGTIDLNAHLVLSNGDNKVLNVDYKSSAKKSKKYFLQMGGYKYLNGFDGGILYLSPNKFEFAITPPEYEALFIELKDYFFYLKTKGLPQYFCDDNILQQTNDLPEDTQV